MTSSHLFHLSAQTPQDKTEGGERIKADAGNFPVLKGMSLYKLLLRPQGLREPHWHPNADELGYCLQGEVLVTFYHTGDLKQAFLVRAGEVFLIPSGALHCIENVGGGSAEILLQFSHENPEEFNLSSSVGMFSNAVLGNTWGVSSKVFEKLNRPLKDRFAVVCKTKAPLSAEAHYENPYRYNLENAEPLIEKAGGSARVARQNVWPILKRQAVYSLKMNTQGMREPHWHPETAELGFVQAGKGRMTVMNPQGQTETYLLQMGDLYYIPKAYPHHIENIGQGQLHFVIFFDQAMPRDIGFSGSIRSFSNEVLGAVLQTEPVFFNQLEKTYADLFIVDRINSIDP